MKLFEALARRANHRYNQQSPHSKTFRVKELLGEEENTMVKRDRNSIPKQCNDSLLSYVHDGSEISSISSALQHFFPKLVTRKECELQGDGSFSTVYGQDNVVWKIMDVEGSMDSFRTLLHSFDEEDDQRFFLKKCHAPYETLKCVIHEIAIQKQASEMNIGPKFYGAIYMNAEDKYPNQKKLTDDYIKKLNEGKLVERDRSYFEERRFKFDVIIVMERLHITLNTYLYYHQGLITEAKMKYIEGEILRLMCIFHDTLGLTSTDLMTKNIMLDEKLTERREPPFEGKIRLIDFGGGFCFGKTQNSFLLSQFALALDVFRITSQALYRGDSILLFKKDCLTGANIITESMNSQMTSERFFGQHAYMLHHYFYKKDSTNAYQKWRKVMKLQ